jgi:hypothetical protein
VQSAVSIQLTQVPPKPTCTQILSTGPCAELWGNYNQAVQQRTREELQLYVNRELASVQTTDPLQRQIAELNKLTTDQQAQINKLNDQIQSDAAAALQAKSAYATAVVHAKTAAHGEGLQEGAGIGVGVTLLVFALRLGIRRLIRNFTVTKKPRTRAASA